nr:hypothetical protein CSF007_p0395 [Yersinia ruckeri]
MTTIFYCQKMVQTLCFLLELTSYLFLLKGLAREFLPS